MVGGKFADEIASINIFTIFILSIAQDVYFIYLWIKIREREKLKGEIIYKKYFNSLN